MPKYWANSGHNGSFGSSPRPRRRRHRRGRDHRERPLHPRHFAGAAVDHDLERAARAVVAGEIDAFLELDAVLVGVEGPHLLVRQHQHGAVGILQAAGLDRRMQVEPQRELVVLGGDLAADGIEHLLAVEPVAVGESTTARLWMTPKLSA